MTVAHVEKDHLGCGHHPPRIRMALPAPTAALADQEMLYPPPPGL